MQHSIWLGKACSANLTVPKRTTAYKWPNNNQSNSLHSTLQVEHLHTEDWHKDLAVPYRHFPASYANTSIHSSKPINAQYVDDIGIAANTPEQLIKNLRAVFQYLRKAGLKLSMAKCHFGVQEVDFFVRTITTKGVAPQKQKITKFLEKVKFPRSKKALRRYIGFLNFYRNYIPRLAERLTPFFQLLKTTDAKTKIPITPDIMKEFREINEALDRCCQLALLQPLPGKQLVLMTDASFQAAGYAVLIEDDPNQKYTSTRKTYAPIAYGSKTYSPSQIKMSIYAKEFLAIYMAFKEFGHVFWGATKPVIIMTDSKSVTRFFQTKMIPPPLWNA